VIQQTTANNNNNNNNNNLGVSARHNQLEIINDQKIKEIRTFYGRTGHSFSDVQNHHPENLNITQLRFVKL
jgi:hypothetical protein